MNPVDSLSHLFTQFPGIGPKQAKRFVYYLMKKDARFKDELIRAVEALKSHGKKCTECFRFFGEFVSQSNDLCPICSSKERENGILMLVEKELDVDAIEKTGAYNGKYFILGGVLPVLAEKPSDHIRIRELASLVHTKIESEMLTEIIFALPVTEQGDTTSTYVEKTLRQIVGADKLTFSLLARGLSSGLELEYVDKNTFKSAFEHRA
jgi:recombination protein RecR